MTFDEYSRLAQAFGFYESKEVAALALAEEAGEYAGKMKRLLRGDFTIDPRLHTLVTGHRAARLLELGDILWSLQEACRQEGATLEEVARFNLDKLRGREARGTIRGSGDNR